MIYRIVSLALIRVFITSLCEAHEPEENKIRDLYSLMYQYMIAKNAAVFGGSNHTRSLEL